MDSTRFDALTRSLATASSRRAFVRTAFAAVAAGIAGRDASVGADECKRDGKRCKKHGQCCSGLCVPEPTAGSTSTSESVCCTPESVEVTCAGRCGDQTNNCDQSVYCGLCIGDQCLADDECASDACCEGACESCPSDTAVCCGSTCCECFLDNKPGGSGGPMCCEPDMICGTYPHDSCRDANETCVDGVRVKTVFVCPHEPGGELVDCRGSTGAGCCNGVCCPNDKPVCAGAVGGVGGVCVAEESCSYQDGATTPCSYGVCTANKWYPSGVCCPGGKMGSWSPGVDENSETITQNLCCDLNEQWPGEDECPDCMPLDYCGCNQCTSRGSTPRF